MNKNPLLWQVAWESNFDLVTSLANLRPLTASWKNSYGSTTLHILALRNPPIETIKALFDAYPAAVQVKNTSGYTPYEYARLSGASTEVVSFLKHVSFSSGNNDCEGMALKLPFPPLLEGVESTLSFQKDMTQAISRIEKRINALDSSFLHSHFTATFEESSALVEESYKQRVLTADRRENADLLRSIFNKGNDAISY
mmetsp:Transcript_8814/g.10244  ORF Transcript_8814/g.10244 Transcript_8814/m.10244 type:complete len:198 (+) Transcript_8814:253-846(+)